MTFSRLISTFFLSLSVAACSDTSQPSYSAEQKESITVLTADEVSYQALNPARGDASPRAGILWGDITKDVPSGILLKFTEGFSSPPHIHNITYRAIVISGEIHNDDPDAANMWMGPGAFWTQPAGEVHVTSARPGVGGTGFLEILEGPYLVQPSEKAFDNGEHPLNLMHSNMVWMSTNEMNWINTNDNTSGPQATLLWGDLSDGALSGSMIKLPSGYHATLSTNGGDLKAVVIQGKLSHVVEDVTTSKEIIAGSYFSSAEGVPHSLSCSTQNECMIYVRTDGQFSVQ
ncbi:DUF4437 domain-containing protein [Hirschia litorea]|uniref:DUF4437 domain-containing protein n=1 Tax=Hirschia litorea TaxID=1199156 RepID=A0ABW2INQ0_9PROT